MRIKVYTNENKKEWDEFIFHSKNGTFLHYRDFIEYHGDRFSDYSLMFYSNDVLIAVMPGNISNNEYFSHQGLTYGGLIMSSATTTSDVLKSFEVLTVTLRHQGIKKIIYKAIPHIYHKSPSEEDLYALFRHNAILTERNISSTILLPNTIPYSKSRKNGLKKVKKNNITISKSEDFSSFWDILSKNLQNKYQKEPIHSISEILFLKRKFPNNIHLFTAQDSNNNMLGGSVIFEMDNIVHIQYISASDEGKRKGSVDAIVDYLISVYSSKKYIDYGTSNENNGYYLNEGLIYHKEGFGSRGIVYDIYAIQL